MSPERNIHWIIGSLEESQKHLADDVKEMKAMLQLHTDNSERYRQCVRDKLDAINAKVDPITTAVNTLELTVKAHEVVLASYADKLGKAKVIGQGLKWVGRAAWLLGGGFIVVNYERLKPLIMFWK